MFLLYFLASSVGKTSASAFFTYNVAWALILVNLIAHWLIKRFRYANIDDDDRRIIDITVLVLVLQLGLVILSVFLEGRAARLASIGALLFGIITWTQLRVYRRKPSRFPHVTERCVLLVIVTFGETVVGISAYMQAGDDLFYSVMVFALVVGLFLIYNYEYDYLLDHHADTDGIAYMTINAWIVVSISNLTIALEFMPDPEIDFLGKSIYLTVCLLSYLLTSLVLSRYNKPEFRHSTPYVFGRIASCAIIVLAGAATGFDPRITLAADVLVVYLALAHEWFLFRSRTRVTEEVKRLGLTPEELFAAGYDLKLANGRLAFLRDLDKLKSELPRETDAAGSAKSTTGSV
jgi:low temperature requirement protein LtrA